MRPFIHGMEARPHKTHQIKWGIFHTMCAILRFIITSAAKAELGALFLNCKQAIIFQLALEEMGHPQPPTTIHCNNSTAVDIAKNTVKRQQYQSMVMRFFEVADAIEQGKFDIKYYPGKENLAVYKSKYYIGAHHTAVHPWYLHKLTSVHELARANKPLGL